MTEHTHSHHMKLHRFLKNKFYYYLTTIELRAKAAKKLHNPALFFSHLHKKNDTDLQIQFTDGFTLKCSDYDLGAIGETCVTEDYQKPTAVKIKPGQIVFDIGANMGSFSVYAAHKGAVVYAFEPVKENYQKLIDNIALNKLEGKIFAFNYGIYSHTGELALNISTENKGGHSSLSTKGTSTESMPVKSLQDVLQELHIARVDLMKMDIEGAEYSIFANIEPDTIAKIEAIVGEYHLFPDYTKHTFKNLQHSLSPYFTTIKSYAPYYFYATK